MNIVERQKVIAAYQRAIALGSDHDEACSVVGRTLALPPETVAAVVTAPEAEVQS